MSSFSISFFGIGIITLLLGAIFYYCYCKFAEFDRQISSMTTVLRMLSHTAFVPPPPSVEKNIEYPSQLMHDDGLISVSDRHDEDSEEEDDDGEEDEDSEEEQDDDGEEDEELEDDDEEPELEELKDEELEPEEEALKELEVLEPEVLEEELPIKVIKMSKDTEEKDTEEELKLDMEVDMDDFKEVSTQEAEYKKMTLSKLRELVVAKALIPDASKLKKQDLLKLLS